ncbi:MAG: S8 family serine peptidase [Chloroflexota bacterium]
MARTFPRLLAVFAAIALAALAGRTQASAPTDDSAPFVPGQVVVGLETGASPQSIGVASTLESQHTPDAVTVAVPDGHEQQYIDAILREPGVRYAELNYLAQPQVIIPNDTGFANQYDMQLIQAPQAWDLTKGAGATVAIVDTGVAFEDYGDFARSPQLQKTTFVYPWDFTKNDTHPNDDLGHGTHVASTVAQDWDGVSEVGIAPEARIMPVKVCSTTGCPGDLMAAGIRWAVDHGASVINMSLGGPTLPTIERDALAYAEANNVPVVAASGNGNAFVGVGTLNYPARDDTVIAVGSSTFDNKRNTYSNWGKHEHTDGMLIMAPGGNSRDDINQDGKPDGIPQMTYAFTCGAGDHNFKDFADCYYQGTSMATPHVAATVALLLARYPDLTAQQVRDVLTCAALDIGPPGVDDQYGVGLVQTYDTIRDTDLNGKPDCLDPRPQMTISVGGGEVEPGRAVAVPVFATTSAVIGSYNILVTGDDSINAVACDVVPGTTCSVTDDGVVISAVDQVSRNDFPIGSVTFEGVAEGTGPPTVSASARLTDDFDPPVQVHTAAGNVIVKQVPQTITGDVNCDGVVNATDVTLSLGYALGVTPAFCWQYGDINCTGRLDPTDALQVLDYISGIEESLPSSCPNNSGG